MLSSFIWVPLIGSAVIGFWPQALTVNRARQLILGILIVLGILSIRLLTQFDLQASDLQFEIQSEWLPMLGVNFHLGLDGLSLPLLVLNTVLTGIVVFSVSDSLRRPQLFFSLILVVNAATSGAFLAHNSLLFFVFYELELIPLYFLISIWGGPRCGYAAFKFLLYTAVSGILMLVGFLALNGLTEAPSFDLADMQVRQVPLSVQVLVMGILLLAFAIKIPLIPLHTWLPDAYGAASAPVSILLGGIISKLGTYGLIRFCLQLFPDAWTTLAPGLATWGALSVTIGSLAAIAQKDIKQMVAYSSIGHMGYILLGCAAATQVSLVGVVALMVTHGLILAILFNLVGLIELKVGTRDLDVLNGLLNPIRGLPVISALLILGGMASAGIPGLASFVAEFLIFQGSYSVYPWQTLIGVIGTGLTAVYFVIMLNRTCFGKLDNDTAYYPPVTWAERLPSLVLAILIVFLGIQPTWMVRWTTTLATEASVALAQLDQPQVMTVVDSQNSQSFQTTSQET